jgi:hypothetical protein
VAPRHGAERSGSGRITSRPSIGGRGRAANPKGRGQGPWTAGSLLPLSLRQPAGEGRSDEVRASMVDTRFPRTRQRAGGPKAAAGCPQSKAGVPDSPGFSTCGMPGGFVILCGDEDHQGLLPGLRGGLAGGPLLSAVVGIGDMVCFLPDAAVDQQATSFPPPSGPAHRLFQEHAAGSKFLAASPKVQPEGPARCRPHVPPGPAA